MKRITTYFLAIALLMTVSGISKSMAATPAEIAVSGSSFVEVGAKSCCKDSHHKAALNSGTCSPLCILTVPNSPRTVLMLSDRLIPPTVTERPGVPQAKLKRPPRTTF